MVYIKMTGIRRYDCTPMDAIGNSLRDPNRERMSINGNNIYLDGEIVLVMNGNTIYKRGYPKYLFLGNNIYRDGRVICRINGNTIHAPDNEVADFRGKPTRKQMVAMLYFVGLL